MKKWFFEHLGPEYEWSQSEAAGLCLRVGNHAWIFGRVDYREKTCPWPSWAHVRVVLGHKPYPDRWRRWQFRGFGLDWDTGE